MKKILEEKDWRARRKKEMIYVMGSKCQLCGYNKCPNALEFHHINPDEKNLSFNRQKEGAWDKLSEELRKCILLCANCHREVHSNLADYNLQSSFDEERDLQIKEKINKTKQRKYYYCKNCGIRVSDNAILCSDCFYKNNRKVLERPSREVLKQLIRTTPFTKIGAMYQISDNAVRKWCAQVGLPYKSSIIKLYSDEEWANI